MRPTITIGGKYPTAPLRHRSENPESFKDRLLKSFFIESSDPIKADVFLALDYSNLDLKILKARKSDGKLNILFRFEPRCVIPDSYKTEVIALFNEIVTFGRTQRDDFSEFWPQFYSVEDRNIWRSERLGKAVLINANKISLETSELYSLRRACIKKIYSLNNFGADWNIGFFRKSLILLKEIKKSGKIPTPSLFSHLRYWFTSWGITSAPVSKMQVLQEYKVCLVIENDLEYMSEKLFDAFEAGCIPVYVGPNIELFEIPKTLVVECSPDVTCIQNKIEKALSINLSTFQRELIAWLKSDKTVNNHHGDIVIRRRIELLRKSLEIHSTD